MPTKVVHHRTKTVSEPVVKKTVVSHKKSDYIQAIGKRKSSIARIRMFHNKTDGNFTVNQKDHKDYFQYFELQQIIMAPFKLLGLEGKHDVSVKVSGGGMKSQAEAIRHGMARALLILDPNFRKALKGAGFITRDPRVKERKKPGLRRARRAPQWQKR